MTDTIEVPIPEGVTFHFDTHVDPAKCIGTRADMEKWRANLDAALAAKPKREWEDWDIVWDPGAKRHVVYIAGSMYWLMRFPAGTLEASSLTPVHFANMPSCGNLRALLEQGQLLALNKAELERAINNLGRNSESDDNRAYAKLSAALAARKERGE